MQHIYTVFFWFFSVCPESGYTSKAPSGGESESEKEDALLARYKCLGGADGPEKKPDRDSKRWVWKMDSSEVGMVIGSNWVCLKLDTP